MTRGRGALEQAVLRIVWTSPAGLTPGEVAERLADGTAYTTVMTVLSRLHGKGLLERVKEGKAFRYRPTLSESELAAERMGADLRAATAPVEVLSHFVARLEPDEVEALRRLLRRSAP